MFASIKKRILRARLWFYTFMIGICTKEAKRYHELFTEWLSDADKYLDKAKKIIEQLDKN